MLRLLVNGVETANMLLAIFFLFCKIDTGLAISQNLTNVTQDLLDEDGFYTSVAKIIGSHFKANGWSTIFTVGRFPGDFYSNIGRRASLVNFRLRAPEQGIDDVPHYATNSVLLETFNMTHFQEAFVKVLESPYWHPHAHILVINRERTDHNLPIMFFTAWYYKAFNVAILQHVDTPEKFLVSEYTPYAHQAYKLQNNYGCWTTKKLGALIRNYAKDFACEPGCHNVTLNSAVRGRNLGTCLGYTTREIKLNNTLNLFQDKSKNYHGYIFRAHNQDLVPFMEVKVDDSGKTSIGKRDGMIWNVMAEKMNFSMDLSPSKDILKKKFRIDTNIKQIVECAARKVDLVLYPVYLMDLVIVEVDMSMPYKDSGLCYLARRAPYLNTLFDGINFSENAGIFSVMIFCVISLWFGIFVFYADENKLGFDIAGKAFANTMRSLLSLGFFKPPSQGTFRILMFTTIWGFFIINFASQATIISYFTTVKRGKEVNTLDDVISKGYRIIGLTTPDAILPDTEERFLKLNAKLEGTQDMYGCAYQLLNDSRRFCMIECSNARYLKRNLLDERGEQYLHVAEERVHSNYLTMVLQRHSPMTARFNKYLSLLVQAGLITKWEENRYEVKKEDIPIKPLGLGELDGVFKLFILMLLFDTGVFLMELIVGNAPRVAEGLRLKYRRWKSTMKAKKQIKLQRKLGQIKLNTTGTQTFEP